LGQALNLSGTARRNGLDNGWLIEVAASHFETGVQIVDRRNAPAKD